MNISMPRNTLGSGCVCLEVKSCFESKPAARARRWKNIADCVLIIEEWVKLWMPQCKARMQAYKCRSGFPHINQSEEVITLRYPSDLFAARSGAIIRLSSLS